jgi:hypothetical protein
MAIDPALTAKAEGLPAVRSGALSNIGTASGDRGEQQSSLVRALNARSGDAEMFAVAMNGSRRCRSCS